MTVPFEQIGPGQVGRYAYQVIGKDGPIFNPSNISYLRPEDVSAPPVFDPHGALAGLAGLNLAASVGTFRSAVHAEMPTPSGTYQRTGTRPMRARYDVGFGHPEDPAGIIGVMELKAGMSTFDQQLGEGFAADFEKLLDPLLPPDAFLISWALAMRSGRISSRDLAERAAAVIAPVESKLGLRGRTGSLDAQTGWLTWRWPSGPTLYLAWYRPRAGLPDRFSPAWR